MAQYKKDRASTKIGTHRSTFTLFVEACQSEEVGVTGETKKNQGKNALCQFVVGGCLMPLLLSPHHPFIDGMVFRRAWGFVSKIYPARHHAFVSAESAIHNSKTTAQRQGNRVLAR